MNDGTSLLHTISLPAWAFDRDRFKYRKPGKGPSLVLRANNPKHKPLDDSYERMQVNDEVVCRV